MTIGKKYYIYIDDYSDLKDMVKAGNVNYILIVFAISISIVSLFVMTSRGFNKVSNLSPNELDGAYSKMYADVYQKRHVRSTLFSK